MSGRRVTAVFAGSITTVALMWTAHAAALHLWSAYAAAYPGKSYSTTMLATRLLAGAIIAALAAWVTSVAANADGTAAWCLGGLLFAVSLVNHIAMVWNDYPAWYHVIYLSSLMPVTSITGHLYARSERRTAHRRTTRGHA
jgi:hypothetical protein